MVSLAGLFGKGRGSVTPPVQVDSRVVTDIQRPVRRADFVEPQGLFDALDGRELSTPGHRWHVEVFSVSDQAQHRWIQLGLNSGDRPHMLTLRMEPGAGVQHAVMALTSWLGDPAEAQAHADVLNVA
jgi:hypothetical protein